MRGSPEDPCRPLALLPVLWLLTRAVRPHGSPAPLQCYCIGPRGDLNCSWGPLGDQEEPSTLHLESRKYHPNRTWTVAVPPGQGWATLARESLTASDQLLVWGTAGGRRLWPPILVNLESRMKPDAPTLDPAVEFPAEAPGEARIEWQLPRWPRHEPLVCRFHYRLHQAAAWTQLDMELGSTSLGPVELRDLQPASKYEVCGQCRVEAEADLWGEWSHVLSFQTLPPAPEDVWISGHRCGVQDRQDPMLLWKAPASSAQTTYTVWYQVEDGLRSRERVPCCCAPIPTTARSAGVSVSEVTAPEPTANLSLGCLAPGSAPRDVAVRPVAGSSGLLVTWRRGSEEAWGYVVDWLPDTDTLGELSWVWLPPENLSVLLAERFEGGVPYQVTVTAVSPQGLAPAPSVWEFREERAPLRGPEMQRLQDDPPGTPTIEWGLVPRHQLRGHLTHYTLCIRTETGAPASCRNVSGSAQRLQLPDLPPGLCELWMTASTRAGQGPPGPSLRFHLPENGLAWKVVLLLFVSLCVFLLVLALCRCSHRVWEKTPDPANSRSCFHQPHVQDLPCAQPPLDLPFLEVEEMEPEPPPEPPQEPPEPPRASGPLDTGYEKHFLPTPEELGLLPPHSPGPRSWPEPALSRAEDAQWTDEDTKDQRG